MKDPDHPQILRVIKEILDRNDLDGLGVEPKGALSPAQAISVQTHVNMPEVHLGSMSDDEFAKYKALLRELRALVPPEEPKMLPATVKR